MGKFHINKNGVPAPCRAKEGNCPLGGASGSESHFKTREEAQSFADKSNELEHSILPGYKKDEIIKFKRLSKSQKEFRDYFSKRSVYVALGNETDGTNVVSEEVFLEFLSENGPEYISERFDKNQFSEDPKEAVKKELEYYFKSKRETESTGTFAMIIPKGTKRVSEVNKEYKEEFDKRMDNASQSIVDIHEVMQDSDDRLVIIEELAKRNENRVFDNFKNSNEIKVGSSGRFSSEDVGKQSARMFEVYASDDNFYKNGKSQNAAEKYYNKSGMELPEDTQENKQAKLAAFSLAKEFHENRVLVDGLSSQRESSVNRVKDKLSKLFPY